MKKGILLGLVAALTLGSCNTEKKNYLTFKGKVTNVKVDSLIIGSTKNRDFKRVVKINEDGTFMDTLKVEKNTYYFMNAQKGIRFEAENGDVVKVSFDAEDFTNSMSITGDKEEINGYYVSKSKLDADIQSKFPDTNLEEEVYAEKVSGLTKGYSDLLAVNEAYLDSLMVDSEKKYIKSLEDHLNKTYVDKKKMNETLGKGMKSPIFENYENYKGGTTSLSDLEGKYVYIDVWATWCGPCKREIPDLKKLEEEYHGKNIHFVSLSVDKANAKDAWKAMIAEKEMGGIQLFADNDWSSSFVKEYLIKGIPRFILIDPNGNIVDADAPRPSSGDKIRGVFTDLGI
ncbi:MAG: TlpA family protein disulfide reductase [Flavobacteriaceae bacterium]|nr:TlpA family protein disulfide reductase [Flavobacteriaceae bacterium]